MSIVPNQNYRKLIPSKFPFDGNKITIGNQTANKIYKDPEKAIYLIKRIIGKNHKDNDYEDLDNNEFSF